MAGTCPCPRSAPASSRARTPRLSADRGLRGSRGRQSQLAALDVVDDAVSMTSLAVVLTHVMMLARRTGTRGEYRTGIDTVCVSSGRKGQLGGPSLIPGYR